MVCLFEDIEDEDVDLCPNDTPGQAKDIDTTRMKMIRWQVEIRSIVSQDRSIVSQDPVNRMKMIRWQENWEWGIWRGHQPLVEILVDEEHKFIIKVTLRYDKKLGSLVGMEVFDTFIEMLREKGVTHYRLTIGSLFVTWSSVCGAPAILTLMTSGVVPKIPVPKAPKAFVKGDVIFEATDESDMDMDSPVEKLKFLDKSKTEAGPKPDDDARGSAEDKYRVEEGDEDFESFEIETSKEVDLSYTRTTVSTRITSSSQCLSTRITS